MGGFVFKQSGTDTRVPRGSVPGLMVRHLQYIATRPGAVKNPECGFGLWGSLAPFAPAENINDLEGTKKLIRQEAEHGRTIYRAVISLGEPEAGERNYYDREKWEALIKDQINVIAEKLQIKPADLRWVAAMHYAEGHPHVHLLYWDAGNEPRQEYMPPAQFEVFSESVRASLNRYEFGSEIQAAQETQKSQMSDIRLELRAMCAECNPTGALNLKEMLESDELQDISEKLDELVRDMPQKGSLKYAYLPEAYKEKVRELISHIMDLPKFSKMLDQYIRAAREVSELYGNGPEVVQANVDKAMEKLERELGNEIMNAVREARAEMEQDAPRTPTGIRQLARESVRSLLIDTPEYEALKAMLPRDRVSRKSMREIPGFQEAKRELLNRLTQDARVRVRLNAYAQSDRAEEEAGEEGNAFSQAYKDFYSAADEELTESLRDDMGYTQEAQETASAMMLCNLFSMLSRMAGQNQAKASLSRQNLASRDKSREAKMDKQKEKEQANGWEPDI